MKNKIVLISILTFLIVIVINATNSFATNSVINEEKYSVPDAEFTIILPKTIVFDENSTSVSYTITCNNNSKKIEKINVIPDSMFTMSQENKEDVTALVSQSITTFKNRAVADVLESNETFGDTINGTIIADLSAGDWIGHFNFYISYKEREYPEITIDSETANLPGIKIENGVLIIPEIVEKDGEEYKVTNIKEGAFGYKYDIKEIIFPESLQIIEANAFTNCNGLTEITIPSNVTVGNNAFQYCTELKTLEIGENVTINENAFIGCSSLNEITIANGAIIGKNAFQYCSSITNVTFEGTATLNEFAFLGCTNLEYIKLPEGLTVIENGLFKNCSNLKTVELPDSLKTIKPEAFMYCSLLKTINIPYGTTSIGADAFHNCSNLELAIPETVISIGRNAFAYMQRIHYYGTATYESDNRYWGAFNLN